MYPKKANKTTSKSKNQKGGKFKEYAHITTVEISGFEGRGVTRAALKELIQGLSYLPNINILHLKKNGLDDEFVDEISEIFENTKIIGIDLS